MDIILLFFGDNKDALTAIGIVLTFLVSVISLYFSVRNNKAVYYVNSVTKSRVEWIQKLKEYASDYLKATICIPDSIYYDERYDIESHIGEIERIKSLIILHLNGDMDSKIVAILNKIQKDYLDLFYLSTIQDDSFIIENDKKIIKVDKNILLNPKLTEIVIDNADNPIFNDFLLIREIDNMKKDNNKIEKFAKAVFDELFEIERDIEKQKEQLLKLIHIYTKVEWRRVKVEATGKAYGKAKKKKYLEELNKKYNTD